MNSRHPRSRERDKFDARRDSGRRWRRYGNLLKRDSADETLAQRIPRIDHDAISSGNGADNNGRRLASGCVTGD